jgi:hypothetical protein
MSDAAGGNIQNVGMDHREIMIACCYDQLKYCCLFYLMENVFKSVQLPTPLPKAISLVMSELRHQLHRSYGFFDHAVHGVLLYAEAAQHRGLDQGEFLDSLPMKEIGILQQIKGPYHGSDDMPLEGTPWYMARILLLNKCPELADVMLERVSQSRSANVQWADILCAGLTTGSVSVILTILNRSPQHEGVSSTVGRRCLHDLLEGPYRDYVAQWLHFMMFDYNQKHLLQAIEEGDLEKLHKLLNLPYIPLEVH